MNFHMMIIEKLSTCLASTRIFQSQIKMSLPLMEINTIWLWAMVAFKLCYRNDAICCHLADTLGKATGKKWI